MNAFTRRIRGFEEVTTDYKIHGKIVNVDGNIKIECPEIKLPQRGTSRSAGYDFYSPIDFTVPARGEFKLYFDVKAYMLGDEVLKLYLRSSVAIKNTLIIKNLTGIVDSDYYSNPENDGNISVLLKNTGSKAISFSAGDRIAQGVFLKYLLADNDSPRSENRLGESGSTGK